LVPDLLLALIFGHALPRNHAILRTTETGACLVAELPASLIDARHAESDARVLTRAYSQRSRDWIRFEPLGRTAVERVAFLELDSLAPGMSRLILTRCQDWEGSTGEIRIEAPFLETAAGESSRLIVVAEKDRATEVSILESQRTAHTFFQGPMSALVVGISTGMRHILSGPDHLLFLLTIVAGAMGWRYWLSVVTSFTLAHSITLVFSGLGLVSAPSRVVEPLIAFTIVVFGTLNVLGTGQDTIRSRVGLVFLCGLVHGLGFATAISDLGVKGFRLVSTLVGFNLGIEFGQVVCLLCLGIGALLVSKIPGAPNRKILARAASGVAAVIGTGWFFQRIFDGWYR
jgi:hydrogenase/urease accessory protein HupE